MPDGADPSRQHPGIISPLLGPLVLVMTPWTPSACYTHKYTRHHCSFYLHIIGYGWDSCSDHPHWLSPSVYPSLDRQSAAWFLEPDLYFQSMSNSCRPRAHLVSFALLGAHSLKYNSGLWSENIVILVANTKLRNFLRANMTAEASCSIVDHLIWVELSLALAKAMGFSVPDFSLASAIIPHSCPYSTTCNFVASHRPFFMASKACWWVAVHSIWLGKPF